MKLINLLGYAGLVPFIALPLLYATPVWLSNSQVISLYHLYSALILGFMAGALWPVMHTSTTTPAKVERLALAAVTFPVLSFVALLCAAEYFLPAQACLFVLLRFSEYRLGINRQYSVSYRSLRNQLTVVVLVSHALLYYLVTL
uniref:DUF3429 domain-containing protein n=1 Tax=Rheinheimera sp. BAL341 TaxID=1708203 RepID=A0A486XSY4_9GAMM